MIEDSIQYGLALKQLIVTTDALTILKKVNGLPFFYDSHKEIVNRLKNQAKNLENEIQEYIKSGRWQR